MLLRLTIQGSLVGFLLRGKLNARVLETCIVGLFMSEVTGHLRVVCPHRMIRVIAGFVRLSLQASDFLSSISDLMNVDFFTFHASGLLFPTEIISLVGGNALLFSIPCIRICNFCSGALSMADVSGPLVNCSSMNRPSVGKLAFTGVTE